MSHKSKSRRRWGLIPLALVLALTLAVVAVPASAKGPVFIPDGCAPVTERGAGSDRLRALCESRGAASDRQGVDGADAGIVAGSVALVVLMMAGGMLVATHRRDAEQSRPAALS